MRSYVKFIAEFVNSFISAAALDCFSRLDGALNEWVDFGKNMMHGGVSLGLLAKKS